MSKELKYYNIIPLKCIQFECIFIKVQMKVKLKNEKVQIIFSNKIFSSRKVNGSCQGLGQGKGDCHHPLDIEIQFCKMKKL